MYWLFPPTEDRGGLAGMEYPDEQFLVELARHDFGLIVNLVESRFEGYDAGQVRVARLPIDDGTAPPAEHFPVLGRLVALMHTVRQHGDRRNVAVHCQAGIGRTGYLMCCYCASVLEVHPDDPEGRCPADTERMVRQRRAEFLELAEASGPHRVQVQAANRFQQWVRSSYRREWETAARGELAWSRGAADAELLGSHWECDLCGMQHVADAAGLGQPQWCLGCGFATDGA
ncbi:MAG: hypothetical protein COZ06_02330 [Armatimonadetes bacterium CG_4_10_14_3_um_filter_66_18]|nr:hypothetical protein [Armatimonadota bacterium]OIP06039.1 MAG: hypothetical protein AUJ96_09685 [Armatimonadetes bacterium CG2_30_66_41]PIU95686.1 MAG: hypothetical protein COS65_01295 [Armatimonadetes bacterium CG06_land_8_20_14_3_00_66_21]PIX47556.1 MAG: hypothetical protein COZ57_08220 [Armatimonadetes bacterium CG_4_8_14_3_um_filter_66_20]PIY52966.1 MAG: hypothetical protein COZ06_02330 [Armatimonadetes bacterium CG_4_10_14_3_um_filter_66_18]PIZ41239.1 MAG: hypothetical protein COY42_19